MSAQQSIFRNFRSYNARISIANGEAIEATGIGEILITVSNRGESETLIRLQDVLYVPALGPNNLLSVRCIQQAGATLVFGGSEPNTVSVQMNGDEIAFAKLQSNSYVLSVEASCGDKNETTNRKANKAQSETDSATLMDWHERLGHLGFEDVKLLAKRTSNITIQGTLDNPTCEPCQLAKQTRKPNSSPATHCATKPLELIHSDVAGPMATPSLGGARYFLLFIDDFSRYTTIYTIKHKSEVIECFRKFKSQVENQQSQRIQRFRSDGGGEYISKEFTRLLDDAGIVREQTAAYSPEQNGVAERANRTIVGRAKAMLFSGGLKDEMWGEAVHTAVYLKNRSPTSALERGMTPLEVYTGEIPKLTATIPFGARGYKHIPKEVRTKWEPNSLPCIFTGYAGTNQYRVLVNRKIHITRDFGLAKVTPKLTTSTDKEQCVPVRITDEDSDDTTTSQIDTDEPKPPTPEPPAAENSSQTPHTPQRNYTPGEFPIDTPLDAIQVRLPAEPQPQEEAYAQRPRRMNAGKFTSTRFHDESFSSLAIHQPDTNPGRFCALQSICTSEPTTYAEAISGTNHEQWKAAIEEELTSLYDNDTWVLTPLPTGRMPVKCKWVFREKKGAEGETVRYKARLVAKGFTQQYGIDYLETYAPVVKLASLRILLAMAAFNNYEIHQGDIKTAYLQGHLDEEIFMEIPEGVTVPVKQTTMDRIVCRLQRGLYGLKQSGRIWNRAWDEFLVGKCNFQRSIVDHAVYYRIGNRQRPLWTIIWVDDVLWIGTAEDIAKAKWELKQRFPLKDLGVAHFFLGMKIIQQPQHRKIILSQVQYIDTILQRFGFQNAYTVSTPMDPGVQLVN